MSTSNSKLIAIRAVIMLGCLVVVPLIALFGASLSEVVRAAWSADRYEDPFELAGPEASPSGPVDLFANAKTDTTPSDYTAEIPAGYEAPMTPPAALPPTADRFTELQQRLQALGATYYRLERLAAEGYRFHCRMEGDPQGVEATHADPLEAMERVVRHYESRRSAVGGRQ